MTRAALERAFGNKLSKNAIQKRDGAYLVVGKWSIVERVGNAWDVWICDPSDMYAGLGQRKVHNICRALKKGPLAAPLRILNGEAFTLVLDTAAILRNASLLGIRLKRQISQAERERLAAMRDAA